MTGDKLFSFFCTRAIQPPFSRGCMTDFWQTFVFNNINLLPNNAGKMCVLHVYQLLFRFMAGLATNKRMFVLL